MDIVVAYVKNIEIFNWSFCRYVKQHYDSELYQKPKDHQLGHPINSYHLIKHIALGWPAVQKEVLSNNTYLKQNFGLMVWNGVLDDICIVLWLMYYNNVYVL